MADDEKKKPSKTSETNKPPKRQPPVFRLGTMEQGMTFGSGFDVGDIGINPTSPGLDDIIRAAINKKPTSK